MILITKFDKSFAVYWWFCIFKKKLAGQLNFNTWLELANAHLKGYTLLWVEQMPKIIQILIDKNIGTVTIQDKNTFI